MDKKNILRETFGVMAGLGMYTHFRRCTKSVARQTPVRFVAGDICTVAMNVAFGTFGYVIATLGFDYIKANLDGGYGWEGWGKNKQETEEAAENDGIRMETDVDEENVDIDLDPVEVEEEDTEHTKFSEWVRKRKSEKGRIDEQGEDDGK